MSRTIFDRVEDPYTIFYTATALKNKIGRPEGETLGDLYALRSFIPVKSGLGNRILQYLMQHPNSHSNAQRAIYSVVARIVKITWLKDLHERQLLRDLEPFLSSTFFFQKIGLEILVETVSQFDQYIPGTVLLSTSSHSYRDSFSAL